MVDLGYFLLEPPPRPNRNLKGTFSKKMLELEYGIEEL